MKIKKSTLKQIISEVITEFASELPDVMRKLRRPMKSPYGPDTSARRASMVRIMKRGGPTLPQFMTRGGEVDLKRPNPQGIHSKRYKELEANVTFILDNAKDLDPEIRRLVIQKKEDLIRAAEKSATAKTFLDLVREETPELFGDTPRDPFLKESALKQIIKEELENVLDEQEIAKDDDVIEEAGKCTGPTKKASSTAKGKKWMKCVKQPGGGYKRVHWGQKGVRVTGKSGNTKRKKSFKARHKCGSAKPGSAQAQACKDWA